MVVRQAILLSESGALTRLLILLQRVGKCSAGEPSGTRKRAKVRRDEQSNTEQRLVAPTHGSPERPATALDSTNVSS
jgi:hypothetical protein